MDNFEDWLNLFGIKTPSKYLNSDSIMTQLSMTQNVDFIKAKRRPHLCNGLATEFQLLGPNVILKLNDTTRLV